VRRLTPNKDPDLLVDASTGDDAAIYRIGTERALVVTVDFITPVVDDPRSWGRISAVNAVSDVYAMGGRPLLALNLMCWNSEELSSALLLEVLLGAEEIASEAGFVIAGGHTIEDPEPKFGLAVVGEVDEGGLLKNAAFRSDDVLILTKPLGIGVVTTAIKAGTAPYTVIESAVASMGTLNQDAARIAVEVGATGATDISGFGLLGHLGRAIQESELDAYLDVDAVPIIDGARELAEAGAIAGGSRRNLQWVEPSLDRGRFDELDTLLLADAQTSGGLLFGVSPSEAQGALDLLLESGHQAAIIGHLHAGNGRLSLI